MPAPSNLLDVTQPPDSQAANLIGQDLRNVALNFQQRMALISGTLANRWNPGADIQPLNWIGLLYFATDTHQVFQWTGGAWVDISGSISNAVSYFNANGATGAIIPANTLQAGSRIQITASAFCSGGAAGNGSVFLQFGGTALGITFTFGHPFGSWVMMQGECQVITPGVPAASQIIGAASYIPGGPGNTTGYALSVTPMTPDTTAPIVVQIVPTAAGGAAITNGPIKVVVTS